MDGQQYPDGKSSLFLPLPVIADAAAIAAGAERRRSVAILAELIDLGRAAATRLDEGYSLDVIALQRRMSVWDLGRAVRLYMGEKAGLLASPAPLTLQDAELALGMRDESGAYTADWDPMSWPQPRNARLGGCGDVGPNSGGSAA